MVTQNSNTDTAGNDSLRVRLMKRASYASITVVAILIAIKTVAWLYVGSVALLGSLVDSLLDLLASFTTLVAIHQAVEPADREHRFGHGKLEAIAGLGQAMVIMISAGFLAYKSAFRLFVPEPVAHGDVGIIVLLVSIALTILLVRYQREVVRQTGSLAVNADSLHYKSDLLMNVAVILALVLTENLGWTYADPLFGIGIAVYIGYTALDIGQQSFDMLMDREMPDEDRVRICDLTLAHKDVKSMHDLRTRSSGFNQFIQLHIELDPDMRLKDVHAVCDDVEATIAKAYPDAEILIHADPVGIEEPHNVFGTRPEALLDQQKQQQQKTGRKKTR